MAILDRVGVTVRRANARVTAPISDPILREWIVGPCFEILDLYDDNGALNPKAVLSTPAKMVGSADISSATILQNLRGKKFTIYVDDGAPQTVTFPSNLATHGRLLTELNSQTSGVVFSLESGNRYLSIVTVSSGDGSSIKIGGDTDANTIFGFVKNQLAVGYSRYKNRRVVSAFTAFPAPRGNMSYLSFSGLTDRIRCFYMQAGNIVEFSRISTVLRNAVRAEYFKFDDTAGVNCIGSPFVDGGPDAAPWALSRANYVVRGLVAMDDNDGDSTTRKLKSAGAPAVFSRVFHNAAKSIVPSTDTANVAAFLVLEADVGNVAGWKTQYIQYKSVDGGTGIEHTFTVNADGLGTASKPWQVTHIYPTGATYEQMAAAINSCTYVVPGSGGKTVAQLIRASVGGVGSEVYDKNMTSFVSLGNVSVGRTGSLTCTMKDVLYGSLGSTRRLAFAVSASPVTDPVTYADLLYTYTYQVKTSALTYTADNHTLSCSANSTNMPGAMGNIITYEARTGDSLSTTVDLDYTDGVLTAVKVIQTFVADTTTYDDLLADLQACEPAKWFADVANAQISGGAGTVPAGWATQSPVAFAGGVSPASIATVVSKMAEDTDCNEDFTPAAGADAGFSDTTLLPVGGVDAAWFVGGWDPINFKDGVASATGKYMHGVVIGDIDLLVAGALNDLSGTNLQLRFCGLETFDIVFTTESSVGDVVNTINASVGYNVASVVNNRLQISSEPVTAALGAYGRRGLDSYVEVLGGNAVNILFGDSRDYVGLYHGSPLAAAPGDRVYDSAQTIGTIVSFEDQVIGGNTYPNSVLVLDREISLSAAYSNWYIRAWSLAFETDDNGVRPLPDLVIDKTNSLFVLKGNVAVSSAGIPLASPNLQMYVSYKALRRDLAEDGIVISNESDLNNVTPWTVENPLGLALKHAFVVGGSIRVYGYGVTDVSEDEPEGTYTAYLSARQFLRRLGSRAYVVVPLTSSPEVCDMLNAHADEMCQPEARVGGQIVISAPKLPAYNTPTALASGTAELVDDNGKQYIKFDEGSVDLQAVLAAAGITGSDLENEDVFFERKIYVDITSDPFHYLVKTADVAGNRVEIHTDGSYWVDNEGNEDGFFAVTPIASMQADGEMCSLLARGSPVNTSDPEAYGEALAAYAQRRASIGVRVLGPDDVQVNVDGIATRVPGYYAAAIMGALVSRRQPSRPMHNMIVPLVTKVFWPEGFDDRAQAIAAGGGYSLLIQDGDGIVRIRDFITTKVTSIEDREHSMIVPDHVAERLFRDVAMPLVGENEIDQGLMTELSFRLQGACAYLVKRGVYRSADIQDIYQDKDNPTQVVVELSRTRKYPLREVLVILL